MGGDFPSADCRPGSAPGRPALQGDTETITGQKRKRLAPQGTVPWGLEVRQTAWGWGLASLSRGWFPQAPENKES